VTTLDNRSRELLDAVPDGVVLVNDDGAIVEANTQAMALFGYQRDEIIGRPLEDLLPKRVWKVHETHRRRFSRNPRRREMGANGDLWGQRRDGSEFPVEVSLSSIDTDQGRWTIGAVRDTSAWQHAQQALAAAQRAADNANQAKTRLLAAASHDLRQPLQALGLYLAVLNRQADLDKRADISRKMQRSLDVMSGILDSLLDISKLDAGAIVPDKRDFPLEDMIEDIIADTAALAERRGLNFRCQGDPCVVRSDRALLMRIVENLVANAIRYTPSGEVSISYRSGDGAARIEVADTGMGIAQSNLAVIFEDYHQLDKSTDGQQRGLGLGLAIVKRLCELLGHPINVRSSLGKGSTFWLDVPLAAAELTTSAPGPARRNRGSILLIEDDAAVADATTMVLEQAGFTVHAAIDASAALRHLDDVRPHVVITDYRLPGQNGLEVIRRIRAKVVDDLPAIMMTGDTSERAIREAGFANLDVLRKPIDTDVLIDLLDGYTQQQSGNPG